MMGSGSREAAGSGTSSDPQLLRSWTDPDGTSDRLRATALGLEGVPLGVRTCTGVLRQGHQDREWPRRGDEAWPGAQEDHAGGTVGARWGRMRRRGPGQEAR